MKYMLQSVCVLRNIMGGGHAEAVRTVECRAGEIRYLVHEPARARGTILLVHGMSPGGNADPRIVSFSRSIAAAGYRVIAPLFSLLADLVIDPSSIDEIAGAIRAFAGSDGRERIGLVSFSFSAGMSLIAACRDDTAGMVSSMFFLGGYCRAETLVRHLMEHEIEDEYPRWIVLKNFYRAACGGSRKLERALEAAALDASFNQTHELPMMRERLSPRERLIFERLRSDREFRIRTHETFTKRCGRLYRALSVPDNIAGCRAAVTIVHGAADPVIPASESYSLYRALIDMGVAARLCVSPLMYHSRTNMGPADLPDIISLIRAFSYFLQNL